MGRINKFYLGDQVYFKSKSGIRLAVIKGYSGRKYLIKYDREFKLVHLNYLRSVKELR